MMVEIKSNEELEGGENVAPVKQIQIFFTRPPESNKPCTFMFAREGTVSGGFTPFYLIGKTQVVHSKKVFVSYSGLEFEAVLNQAKSEIRDWNGSDFSPAPLNSLFTLQVLRQ